MCKMLNSKPLQGTASLAITRVPLGSLKELSLRPFKNASHGYPWLHKKLHLHCYQTNH